MVDPVVKSEGAWARGTALSVQEGDWNLNSLVKCTWGPLTPPVRAWIPTEGGCKLSAVLGPHPLITEVGDTAHLFMI